MKDELEQLLKSLHLKCVLEQFDDEVKRAEQLNFEKNGVVLTVLKDERGKLQIKVTGPKGSDAKMLQEEGRHFTQELAQLFAFNRAAEQIETLNAEVVDQQENEEGDIVLRVRRWT